MKTLNEELIERLRGAQKARASAVSQFDAETGRYKLTSEGRVEVAKRLANGIHGKIDGYTQEGLKLIDEQIASLDRAEADNLNSRYLDVEYLQRLHTKLQLVRHIASDLTAGVEVPSQARLTGYDHLKPFLSEFENDPVAISALRETLAFDPMGAINILPEDHTGERQQRLEAFKRNFSDAMQACHTLADEAGASGFKGGNLSTDAIIDNLCNYLSAQEPDFSLEPSECWPRMRKAGEPEPQTMTFDFRFKGVRPHDAT